MRNLLGFIGALGVGATALADDAGVRLSKDELTALVINAETSYLTRSGSLHRWRNDPGGNFVVSTDHKKHGSVMGIKASSAPGTWRISDEGKYCVQIEWRREKEDWCAYVVKGEDGGYYLNKVDPARKIEFLK
jgi:hypothetical protein